MNKAHERSGASLLAGIGRRVQGPLPASPSHSAPNLFDAIDGGTRSSPPPLLTSASPSTHTHGGSVRAATAGLVIASPIGGGGGGPATASRDDRFFASISDRDLVHSCQSVYVCGGPLGQRCVHAALARLTRCRRGVMRSPPAALAPLSRRVCGLPSLSRASRRSRAAFLSSVRRPPCNLSPPPSRRITVSRLRLRLFIARARRSRSVVSRRGRGGPALAALRRARDTPLRPPLLPRAPQQKLFHRARPPARRRVPRRAGARRAGASSRERRSCCFFAIVLARASGARLRSRRVTKLLICLSACLRWMLVARAAGGARHAVASRLRPRRAPRRGALPRARPGESLFHLSPQRPYLFHLSCPSQRVVLGVTAGGRRKKRCVRACVRWQASFGAFFHGRDKPSDDGRRAAEKFYEPAKGWQECTHSAAPAQQVYHRLH